MAFLNIFLLLEAFLFVGKIILLVFLYKDMKENTDNPLLWLLVILLLPFLLGILLYILVGRNSERREM